MEPTRYAGYMRRSTTSYLDPYMNQEQDYIRRAFSASSFTMLQHLPNDLRHSHVSKARADHIDSNIASAQPSFLLSKSHGPYFQAFPYASEAGSLADELEKKQAAGAGATGATGRQGAEAAPVWRPPHHNPATAHNPPKPRLAVSPCNLRFPYTHLLLKPVLAPSLTHSRPLPTLLYSPSLGPPDNGEERPGADRVPRLDHARGPGRRRSR